MSAKKLIDWAFIGVMVASVGAAFAPTTSAWLSLPSILYQFLHSLKQSLLRPPS